ncbi:hypothetical protein BKA62DRAFT_259285 [Auriculariales sp. MPI-PUGE-AT-0066]|nr:hypothetical protein BKA62DRAFT_259285 [Auriculariales sp. MPI-PUGE-AT-0066]
MFPYNDHSIEHNMSLFKFEISRNRSLRARNDLEDRLKPAVPAPRYSDSDAETGKKSKLLPEICVGCKKEMDGEFYACKSCGDFALPQLILCEECAFKPELTSVEGHSQQTHLLSLIRNRNTSYLYGAPSSEQEKSSDAAEEPTMKDLVEHVKSLQSRLDVMDGRMNRLDTLDQRMDTLDQRMSRLDNIEKLLIQLVQQLPGSPPINAASE